MCVLRPGLDATSSREFSQKYSFLSMEHVSIAPCDQLEALSTALDYELLDCGASLGAVRCFPLEVVCCFIAAMVFPC